MQTLCYLFYTNVEMKTKLVKFNYYPFLFFIFPYNVCFSSQAHIQQLHVNHSNYYSLNLICILSQAIKF